LGSRAPPDAWDRVRQHGGVGAFVGFGACPLAGRLPGSLIIVSSVPGRLSFYGFFSPVIWG
jgi:hypothetical protein